MSVEVAPVALVVLVVVSSPPKMSSKVIKHDAQTLSDLPGHRQHAKTGDYTQLNQGIWREIHLDRDDGKGSDYVILKKSYSINKLPKEKAGQHNQNSRRPGEKRKDTTEDRIEVTPLRRTRRAEELDEHAKEAPCCPPSGLMRLGRPRIRMRRQEVMVGGAWENSRRE